MYLPNFGIQSVLLVIIALLATSHLTVRFSQGSLLETVRSHAGWYYELPLITRFTEAKARSEPMVCFELFSKNHNIVNTIISLPLSPVSTPASSISLGTSYGEGILRGRILWGRILSTESYGRNHRIQSEGNWPLSRSTVTKFQHVRRSAWLAGIAKRETGEESHLNLVNNFSAWNALLSLKLAASCPSFWQKDNFV